MNQRAGRSQVLLVAMLLWACAYAPAQDAYLARWEALHARQPEAVSFRISAAKDDFYLGELIPLQLSFTSTQPKGFLADTRLYDRAGRMNGVEEFLVDPDAFIEDPLHGLPGESGGMGGLSAGSVLLSGKPFSLERVLNEWVRFRKPGRYRIAVLSRRVAQTSDPERSEYYLTHARGAGLELVSNILTLNIVPAPAAWVNEQIAEAVRVLDGPPDLSEEAHRQRVRAGRTLRFLDSPEAAAELVRHMGSGEDTDSWALQMGVLGSPYRKQLLPLMEALLIAPDRPISYRDIDTLCRLSALVSGGSTDLLRGKYMDRLIASLPGKQPEARAVSMNTLLDSSGGDGAASPSWLPAVAASLIADFRALSPKMQSKLLESRWGVIRSPAMLPVLREIYLHPPEPRVEPPLRDAAVRRIYDLAPEEGRRIIISAIAQTDTYLSLETLEMLPDRNLPELNGVLASGLEANQYPDSLILRYATGDIVQRVEAAYRKRNEELDREKLPHCGGPLVYYFLQHDPAFGERELREEMGKPAPFPACYDLGFQFAELGRHAYSPALERLAIEFLASPKVPVKRGAAEVLGKYGSPAAQKPLWQTLEYFRSWWKGREKELDEQNGQEGTQLERALRIALAQADGWTLREDGLNRLLGLCSSDWCRQDVKGWLSQATAPVEIQIVPGFGGFRARVAQYETRSDEQLRRKILQFSAGTVFRVVPFVKGDDHARAEQIVRLAGYLLAAQ